MSTPVAQALALVPETLIVYLLKLRPYKRLGALPSLAPEFRSPCTREAGNVRDVRLLVRRPWPASAVSPVAARSSG
jgi:hypothetical protein